MIKKNIILLGAPGSGKGTQAARLVAEFSYNHVSTGDLLRAEIKKGSELGKKLENIVAAGLLVDDMTVLELLKNNCDLEDNAYIFDGFPRNGEQAELLDENVLKNAPSVAIYLKVDLEELVSRIINRRTCSQKSCGEIYNLVSKPPKEAGKCNKCGADIVQRADDNEEIVRNRFSVFTGEIERILDYYRAQDRLEVVDASIGPDVTFEAIKKVLN